MPKLEMKMLLQGFEIGRSDFGDSLRDRIAFEVAFSMNCLCGSKNAFIDLLYSSADAIVEAFNKDQVIWTKANETPPSAVHGCVLMRYHRKDQKAWRVSLVYFIAGDGFGDGEWLTAGDGPPPWPDQCEWMAIPI